MYLTKADSNTDATATGKDAIRLLFSSWLYNFFINVHFKNQKEI